MRYLFALLLPILFASCDVKRKDRISDDAAKLSEQALNDTTTVELIDSLHDFGTITEGDKVEYNFRFRNSGKKPLIIINASATCGCTVPKKPEKPIMPGEIGYLTVVFNSAGKPGHVSKDIVVRSNAWPPIPNLVIAGEVKKKQ